MRGAFLMAAALLFAHTAAAIDYGVSVENDLESSPSSIANYITASPWFKFVFNSRVSFFFSFDFINENTNVGWNFVPQLGTTEFVITPVPNLRIAAGRTAYTDASTVIADGIFDGVTGNYSFAYGRFTFSTFYTGLLQKDQTKIIMSSADQASYDDSENYYAPKKVFTSGDIELRDIFGYKNLFRAGYLTLFDIAQEKHDHQYFSLNAQLPVKSTFVFAFSSVIGTSEKEEDIIVSNTGQLSVQWLPKMTRAQDNFMLTYIWSSGLGDTNTGPFTPVTFHEYGDVLPVPLNNISICKFSYTVENAPLFLLTTTLRWFFRTSRQIPLYYEEDFSDAMSLGQEWYTSINWAPLSDAMFDAGLGFFFPSVFFKQYSEMLLWKFRLNVKVTL
jgi:hypothetical protein